MPATRTAKLGERTVTVRELTVAEVRARLMGAEAGAPVDALRALVFDGFGLDELAYMSDITGEELEAYAPSDIEAELVPACKAVNPFFFRMQKAIHDAGMRLQVEILSQHSTAPRAPWWSAVTRVFGRIRGRRS